MWLSNFEQNIKISAFHYVMTINIDIVVSQYRYDDVSIMIFRIHKMECHRPEGFALLESAAAHQESLKRCKDTFRSSAKGVLSKFDNQSRRCSSPKKRNQGPKVWSGCWRLIRCRKFVPARVVGSILLSTTRSCSGCRFVYRVKQHSLQDNVIRYPTISQFAINETETGQSVRHIRWRENQRPSFHICVASSPGNVCQSSRKLNNSR